MNRRPGATLLEVMVAIFVMGIGMIALLALFPIGILTMRQAIQDDRAATAGASATSIAKTIISPSSFGQWFNQADWDRQKVLVPATPVGPSYPLFLDILGFRSFGGANQLPADWVSGQNNLIRRLEYPSPTAGAAGNDPRYWQISPDDVVFGKTTGTPLFINKNIFERNSAFSWAYLLQRPQNGKPNVVNLTVVVYNERPTALNTNFQPGETTYTATFQVNGAVNTVQITWNPAAGDVAPAISVGSWILDSSPVLAANGTLPNGPWAPCHARFYRVVSLIQTANNSITLEVNAPITGFPLPAPMPAAQQFTGSITVIEGIAEVFERGAVEWQNP